MRITDVLAVYAATLSTAVFSWNVLQSRPRVQVDLLPGTCGVGQATRFGVHIIVRNVSSHAVHLSAVELMHPMSVPTLWDRFEHVWRYQRLPRRLGWVRTGLSYYQIESGCPATVEARSALRVFVPEEVVEQLLAGAPDRSLIAVVQDQLWTDYYSRPFRHLTT